MDNKIDVNRIRKETLKQEEQSIQLLSLQMDTININTDGMCICDDNYNTVNTVNTVNNERIINNDDTFDQIMNVNKSFNNISNIINVQDKSSVCYRHTYLKRKLCKTGFYSIIRNRKY
jgi:hypothetical protein